MVAAIVFQLQPVTETRLPVSHGAFAYASAMDLILRVDPALSRALHDSPGVQPLTVSPLRGEMRREGPEFVLDAGALYEWRLTGVSREAAEGLLRLSPALGGVRIGPAVFQVAGVCSLPEEQPDAGRDTYEALYQRWSEGPLPRSVTLEFLTPTTFRRNGFEQPFPLPRQVFGHLADVWNAYSSVPLGDLRALLGDGVILGRWRGETLRVEMGARRTVGFVGSFTYRPVEAIPELQRLLGMLSEFAFYAGVGWQRAHGMGQVRCIAHGD